MAASQSKQLEMFRLTKRQAEVLEYYVWHLTTYDRPPAVRDIAKRFKFASPNGALDHLRVLVKKGMLTKRNQYYLIDWRRWYWYSQCARQGRMAT